MTDTEREIVSRALIRWRASSPPYVFREVDVIPPPTRLITTAEVTIEEMFPRYTVVLWEWWYGGSYDSKCMGREERATAYHDPAIAAREALRRWAGA